MYELMEEIWKHLGGGEVPDGGHTAAWYDDVRELLLDVEEPSVKKDEIEDQLADSPWHSVVVDVNNVGDVCSEMFKRHRKISSADVVSLLIDFVWRRGLDSDLSEDVVKFDTLVLAANMKGVCPDGLALTLFLRGVCSIPRCAVFRMSRLLLCCQFFLCR
mmetsp:Transcript_86538/g.197490  ORF Transcript_86538/g.197490 Transcript_86538/m.197490 type:complete len:160 (+) Transcript_86538:247-726(+)